MTSKTQGEVQGESLIKMTQKECLKNLKVFHGDNIAFANV